MSQSVFVQSREGVRALLHDPRLYGGPPLRSRCSHPSAWTRASTARKGREAEAKGSGRKGLAPLADTSTQGGDGRPRRLTGGGPSAPGQSSPGPRSAPSSSVSCSLATAINLARQQKNRETGRPNDRTTDPPTDRVTAPRTAPPRSSQKEGRYVLQMSRWEGRRSPGWKSTLQHPTSRPVPAEPARTFPRMRESTARLSTYDSITHNVDFPRCSGLPPPRRHRHRRKMKDERLHMCWNVLSAWWLEGIIIGRTEKNKKNKQTKESPPPPTAALRCARRCITVLCAAPEETEL